MPSQYCEHNIRRIKCSMCSRSTTNKEGRMAKAKDNPIDGLNRFEGKDVMAATIAVTGAGDGLSEAMDVGPTEYHQGDTVYTVMEHVVSKVTYEDMPKQEGALRRKHTFKTQHATVVDGQSVATALAEHKRLVQLRREQLEEEKGVIKLPGTGVKDTDTDTGTEPDDELSE